MNDFKTEFWISDERLDSTYSSSYWNNEEIEKAKRYFYLDDSQSKDFSEIEARLNSIGLVPDLIKCDKVARRRFYRGLSGTGIDLAAGILWAVPHLFRKFDIKKLYCLELSKHRLLKIGPQLLEHYKVEKSKVVLALGSFYEIALPDKSLDFVLLSQAYHHADDPIRLLREVHRVLRPDGLCVIVGEHNINAVHCYLRHYAKWGVSKFPVLVQKKIFGKCFPATRFAVSLAELLAPDLHSGDHYYTLNQYRAAFHVSNFVGIRVGARSRLYQSFVLRKRK